ncbi:signal recognition particle subunit SRP72 [Coleophoma crateriformis]|uniref:Signal recognition particle subunit SRP72 n=1 Tax=Coleophoma crateriformis TaxID=565419 RepID=A0A3D8QUK5_9HELO|nr:signal recognition particle subunit SRP72 [Coleophoma crateriformis]
MASNSTATLTSLLRSSSITDHDEVLKAANAVLKSSKNNPDALHTRVVALVKLDRFEDALRALDDGGDQLAERCTLEKAYALYKTGQLAEAEKLASSSLSGKNRGLKHIAAQVAYRGEKFEDAAQIYKELSAESVGIEGEENDLRINGAAVDAQLQWQGKGSKVQESRKKPAREDLEAFETAYNAACGCIAGGDLGAGSVLLKRARDLCEALDELSDEEKRAEVLPIMVQQAFVFTKLGKLEEAEVLQKMVNIADVPEPPTKVVAQNNAMVASGEPENPYLAQRVFDAVPKLSKTEQLFEHQASLLRRNRYAIDLQARKYEGVARSTAAIIKSSSSPTTSPFIGNLAVVNAAAHGRSRIDKAGLKHILPLLEKRPNDVGLILTIVQLYVLMNNPGPAIELLESFFKRLEESATTADQDVRYTPGLVALAVSLYRLQGRKAPIRNELGNAALYWKRKQKTPVCLLQPAGIALLESSNPEDLKTAGQIFENLRAKDANDRVAIAGYVASYAISDFSKVEANLDKLTSVERLTSGIDAAALEEAGVANLPRPTDAMSKKRNADNEKEKPSKKRKIRKLPKDYEEGRKMDPERWLPLRDRSTYRPKGKKGKKKAMDMTQGGVVKEEESLELVGGSAVKVEKSVPSKNKKKKGKK